MITLFIDSVSTVSRDLLLNIFIQRVR